eukprot:jgi/Galph1/600/GphlegSOOS_G5377.1
MPQPLYTLRQLPRAEYASKLSLVYPKYYEKKLSNAELHREIEQNAAILRLAGFTPGTQLALCLDDPLEYIIVFLACMWIGVIVYPISTDISAHKLKEIVRTTKLETIVCSEVEGQKGANTASAVAQELNLYCLLVSQTINEGVQIQMQDLGFKSMTFEDRHYKLEPSNPAVRIHVETSSGEDNYVTFTHEHVIKAMELAVKMGKLTGQDVAFLPEHPSNISRFILQFLAPLSVGSTVLISPNDIHMESSKCIEKILPFGITWLSASLPIVKELHNIPKANLLFEKLHQYWCLTDDVLSETEFSEILQFHRKSHVPTHIVFGVPEALGLLFIYNLDQGNGEDPQQIIWSYPLGKPLETVSTCLADPETSTTVQKQGIVCVQAEHIPKEICKSIFEQTLPWICTEEEATFRVVETTKAYLQRKADLEKQRKERERQTLNQHKETPQSGGRLERNYPKVAAESGGKVNKKEKEESYTNKSHKISPEPSHPRRKSADLDRYPVFDDSEPGYFKVGKSTFSLADIDYILQKHPASHNVKSFLLEKEETGNLEVHVALTLNPGYRVTVETFTKHLKEWGIRGRALPAHYYICRRFPTTEGGQQTRDFIKTHCLSMPQQRVTEAFNDAGQSTGSQEKPTKGEHSRRNGSWLRRSFSKTLSQLADSDEPSDGTLKRSSSKILQMVRRTSFSS